MVAKLVIHASVSEKVRVAWLNDSPRAVAHTPSQNNLENSPIEGPRRGEGRGEMRAALLPDSEDGDECWRGVPTSAL